MACNFEAAEPSPSLCTVFVEVDTGKLQRCGELRVRGNACERNKRGRCWVYLCKQCDFGTSTTEHMEKHADEHGHVLEKQLNDGFER